MGSRSDDPRSRSLRCNVVVVACGCEPKPAVLTGKRHPGPVDVEDLHDLVREPVEDVSDVAGPGDRPRVVGEDP